MVATPLFLIGCTKPIATTPANVNSTSGDAFDDLVADSGPVDVEPVDQVAHDSERPAQEEAAIAEEAEADRFLTIGDMAPAIVASSWAKGQPVQEFEPGEVYVVEFWATWCGPCRTSMPHISALQEEYGDAVRFIGLSKETEQVVREFLGSSQSDERSWDEAVKYRLAMDGGGATYNAYMSAAGQNGIPTAFIVGRDGMLEWIGHPMSMDEPLRQVVADTWDRLAARNEYEAQERAERARNKAMATISQAIRDQDWDAALGAIEPLVAEFPEDARTKQLKMAILQRAGRTQELQKLQAEVVESQWEDAMPLNEIAWSIATGNEPRDLQLALRAAEQANKLTQESNGAILDTLARVHYELGDLGMAITWQQKAVEVQSESDELRKTLDRYQTEKTRPADEEPSGNEKPE